MYAFDENYPTQNTHRIQELSDKIGQKQVNARQVDYYFANIRLNYFSLQLI